MNKLFEKDAAGLLHEVPADQADALRATRRITHLVIGAIDVLFTPEEEAARDAEVQADQEAETARAAARAELKTRRQAALAKLGLTDEEFAALGIARQ
jgi:hypothetical protein